MSKPHCLTILFCLLLFLCGCSHAPQKEAAVTQDFFAMDTYARIILYGKNAEQAASAAEAEMRRLDKLLSSYEESSEVSALHNRRTAVVSNDTAKLLTRSLQLRNETDGAFDITLAPLSRLWGFPHGPYRVPDRTEIEAALLQAGMDTIIWDSASRQCTLKKPAVTLDFGGIAKGYAADRMAAIVKEQQIRHALLNLGGNVKAIGDKPDHSPWRVAIRHPDDKNGYLGIVSVKDMSVVTSGDYERFFEKDKERYHHILDPKTGAPARSGIRSATIVCRDCATADGLSTALFVMGSQAAVSFWKKDPARFQFILFTEDRTLYVSEGLLPLFETTLAVTPVR